MVGGIEDQDVVKVLVTIVFRADNANHLDFVQSWTWQVPFPHSAQVCRNS